MSEPVVAGLGSRAGGCRSTRVPPPTGRSPAQILLAWLWHNPPLLLLIAKGALTRSRGTRAVQAAASVSSSGRGKGEGRRRQRPLAAAASSDRPLRPTSAHGTLRLAHLSLQATNSDLGPSRPLCPEPGLPEQSMTACARGTGVARPVKSPAAGAGRARFLLSPPPLPSPPVGQDVAPLPSRAAPGSAPRPSRRRSPLPVALGRPARSASSLA